MSSVKSDWMRESMSVRVRKSEIVRESESESVIWFPAFVWRSDISFCIWAPKGKNWVGGPQNNTHGGPKIASVLVIFGFSVGVQKSNYYQNIHPSRILPPGLNFTGPYYLIKIFYCISGRFRPFPECFLMFFNLSYTGAGAEIRPFFSILGPEIIFFFIFFSMEKTGNSIQSGSNLGSFVFYRGVRV